LNTGISLKQETPSTEKLAAINPALEPGAGIRCDQPNPNSWLVSRIRQLTGIASRNPSARRFDRHCPTVKGNEDQPVLAQHVQQNRVFGDSMLAPHPVGEMGNSQFLIQTQTGLDVFTL
jgi:hypothetical protein